MKPENGDTWQFAAVPFEAGNHLSNIQAKAHALLIGHREVHHEPYPGSEEVAKRTICGMPVSNKWLRSGLRCSSAFAKIATKLAFSSQQQDPAAALGVQRPIPGDHLLAISHQSFQHFPWPVVSLYNDMQSVHTVCTFCKCIS